MMPLATRTARLPGPDNRSKAPLNNGHALLEFRRPGWLSLPAVGANLLRAPNPEGRLKLDLFRPAAATRLPSGAITFNSPVARIAQSIRDNTTPDDDLDALFITKTSQIVVAYKPENGAKPCQQLRMRSCFSVRTLGDSALRS